jgi:O-antigen/teichoic acid export membrane protein
MIDIASAVTRLKGVLKRDILRARQAGVMHIGLSNFLTRLTALAQRILLARILGAENIGHIAVVTAALSIIRLPAGAGTFTVVNKLVAENADDQAVQREVVGTSIRVNLVTTLTVCVLAWMILTKTSWLNDLVANRFLRALILFLPLMIFSEIMKNALMGQRRMRTVAGIDIALSLLAIVVVVPMAFMWSIKGWFFNQILIILVMCILLSWNLRHILSLKWNKAIAKKVASIGSFAFLGQLVGALILQFDTLSISGILKNAATTGIYNSAALVAQQMLVVPGAILIVVFPFVAQNKNDLAKLKQRYWELFRKIGGLAIGLSAFAWVLCPWFFPILGREFTKSVAPFRVLVIGFIALSLFVLDNTYLDALGRTDITFASGLLAMTLTIVLNITFIPQWGMMGAAWATTISMFVSLAIRQAAVHYFIFHKYAIR